MLLQRGVANSVSKDHLLLDAAVLRLQGPHLKRVPEPTALPLCEAEAIRAGTQAHKFQTYQVLHPNEAFTQSHRFGHLTSSSLGGIISSQSSSIWLGGVSDSYAPESEELAMPRAQISLPQPSPEAFRGGLPVLTVDWSR